MWSSNTNYILGGIVVALWLIFAADFIGDLLIPVPEPPKEIPAFKNVIAKADQIQRLSADYIYAHANSCVDRDAELIFSYLGSL